MIIARPRFLIVVLTSILCACAGPSLQYKKDISNLMANQQFENASAKIKANQKKQYGDRNAVLYQLDLALTQQASYNTKDSTANFLEAQRLNDDLITKSVTKNLGSVMINDNTLPYKMPMYEQALNYFFTALNYLGENNFEDAAVEMRKAVFFLDRYRESTKKTYNDDPFVQYFASMIFEDIGQLSSARIARTNALNAYEKLKGYFNASAPDSTLPPNYKDLGELVFIHYSGKSPIKISNQVSVSWDRLGFILNNNNSLQGTPKQTIDAVFSGLYGRTIAISYPVYIDALYQGRTSAIVLQDGRLIKTKNVSDIASAAKLTLEEESSAIWARTATRVVTKFILSKQAHDVARKNSDNDGMTFLVDLATTIFNTATEQADTRAWATLPAQIKMANVFLEPGEYNIDFYNYNAAGMPIDTYHFDNVKIKKGTRTYLWRYSSK